MVMVVVVLVGLESRNGVGRGAGVACLPEQNPPVGKGMVPVLFCRVFVTYCVMCRILKLKRVFIC